MTGKSLRRPFVSIVDDCSGFLFCNGSMYFPRLCLSFILLFFLIRSLSLLLVIAHILIPMHIPMPSASQHYHPVSATPPCVSCIYGIYKILNDEHQQARTYELHDPRIGLGSQLDIRRPYHRVVPEKSFSSLNAYFTGLAIFCSRTVDSI